MATIGYWGKYKVCEWPDRKSGDYLNARIYSFFLGFDNNLSEFIRGRKDSTITDLIKQTIFTWKWQGSLLGRSIFLCLMSLRSLAMGSCSYSCVMDHPTCNRSTNLINLFLSFSFAAEISPTLLFDVFCWRSYAIKAISVLNSNVSLLPSNS